MTGNRITASGPAPSASLAYDVFSEPSHGSASRRLIEGMNYRLYFGRPQRPSWGDSADLRLRSHGSPRSARVGDFDASKVVVRCELPTFFRAAFQTQLDRFSDIAECLSSRASLADTARNHGTLRDYVSVLPGVEYDWQLHVWREYHLARLLENGSRAAIFPDEVFGDRNPTKFKHLI
jgi:hypothetical protein